VGLGDLRHSVDPVLHVTRIEPLPDLIIHLPPLQVALESSVGPTPDAHTPVGDLLDFVEDDADAYAYPHPQGEIANLEQHVSALEWGVGPVVGSNPFGIGEFVIAKQTLRGLE